MKVVRNEVLAANSKNLRYFTPGMTKEDTLDTINTKVGDSLTIIPKDTDSKTITVRFDLNALIALADEEPDTKTLIKALGALGVQGANALKSGGTLNLVINGATAAGSAADVANTLFKTQAGGKSLSFYVPVNGTKKNCKYTISTTIHAITLTTDNDDFEVARIQTYANWNNARSSKAEKENIGTKRALRANHNHDLTEQPGNDGTSLAAVWALIDLSTDGDWWHDTISAVSLQSIEIIITEECPEDGKDGQGGGKDSQGKGGADGQGKPDSHGKNDDDKDEDEKDGNGDTSSKGEGHAAGGASSSSDDKNEEKPEKEDQDDKPPSGKAFSLIKSNQDSISELQERLGNLEGTLEEVLSFIKNS